MSGNVFLDTNVLAYLYSTTEPLKRSKSISVLTGYLCVTSTQALNEFSNVFIKKYKMSKAFIKQAITNISKTCNVQQITEQTINSALDLNDTYGYSFYDCLMIASALENYCDTLFSEDMASGQLIEGKLKIINPYQVV